jgi:hypothetical protein
MEKENGKHRQVRKSEAILDTRSELQHPHNVVGVSPCEFLREMNVILEIVTTYNSPPPPNDRSSSIPPNWNHIKRGNLITFANQ